MTAEDHRQGAADGDQPGTDHQRHVHQRAPDQARQQERPDQAGVFERRKQGSGGPLKTGEQQKLANAANQSGAEHP
jgi:hypothetical protein